MIDCARQVIELAGYHAELKTLPDKPTGPLNRVADSSLSRRVLGWQPEMRFEDGLRRSQSSGISRRTNVTLWSSWSSRVA